MSNQISTFNFENHSLSTIIISGEIFFHATELANILGFCNPRQAIATHVDKEDVQKLDTLTKGGKQKTTFINESGMYALIFGSTKDEAKRFKRWVTSEVLPTIRKTGTYSLNINNEQSYFLNENQAREFDAKLKHIFDLANLVDGSRPAQLLRQRAKELNQFLAHDVVR